MPDVPRLGSGIPLVARGREISRLRAAFDRAVEGTSGAVLIAGDAGVGKTRLVEELTGTATEAGAVVLSGRCVDVGETGLPYLPFAEALTQVRALGRPELLARPALGMLLPDLAPPVRDAPVPEPQRFVPSYGQVQGQPPRREQDLGQLQLFDAVHVLLSELAEQNCVVLVVEDLHWADGSTRGLLSFLLSRLRTQRLLVVGTYRTDDLHRRHPLRPLLAEVVRLPAVERLELPPFDKNDARAFVTALAEGGLDAETVRLVANQSEGNAFFAEELLAAFADTGSRCGVPDSLADVLLARVERLSEAAQRVIRVAAVAGRTVKHRTLSEVVGLDEVQLEGALREAVQHRIFVVDGDQQERYSFRHALMREAVYGDLLPGERVRLHATYARYLAGQPSERGSAAALAYHSVESNALPAALAASVQAANEARELGAPAESLRHLEQALRLWDAVDEQQRPAGTDELKLLRKASWAAGTSGEPERAVAYARSAVRLADERHDPELAAEVRRRLAHTLMAVEAEEEARAVIERAWQLVADRSPSQTRAWVLAVQARIQRNEGELDTAKQLAEAAVRDARATGAGGAEADALATLGVISEATGQSATSRDLLVQARDRAAAADAITVELRARYLLGLNQQDAGLLDEAVAAFDDGVRRAKDTGLAWSDYGLELRVLQVLTRFAMGDWDAAEQAAEQPRNSVSGTVSARLAAAGLPVLVGRGRFAEAERLVTGLRADWHRDLQIPLWAGPAGAELACWRGKPDVAVDRSTDALDWIGRVAGSWILGGIRVGAIGVAACADVAARARGKKDTDTVERATADGERFVERVWYAVKHGRSRNGELGPEGRAWLARAEAELTRLRGCSDPQAWTSAVDAFGYGAVYEQAVCRWRLGEALLAADRRDEATEQLRLTWQTATRLGARPLGDAVTHLARRARIALDEAAAAPRDTVDLFTPRERAVLRLVALGQTNRQVGAELFISEKTVSVHLSRIMAKLGASRRAEAVAIAYDRGLLD